jgi:hypothetical protein
MGAGGRKNEGTGIHPSSPPASILPRPWILSPIDPRKDWRGEGAQETTGPDIESIMTFELGLGLVFRPARLSYDMLRLNRGWTRLEIRSSLHEVGIPRRKEDTSKKARSLPRYRNRLGRFRYTGGNKRNVRREMSTRGFRRILYCNVEYGNMQSSSSTKDILPCKAENSDKAGRQAKASKQENPNLYAAKTRERS